MINYSDTFLNEFYALATAKYPHLSKKKISLMLNHFFSTVKEAMHNEDSFKKIALPYMCTIEPGYKKVMKYVLNNSYRVDKIRIDYDKLCKDTNKKNVLELYIGEHPREVLLPLLSEILNKQTQEGTDSIQNTSDESKMPKYW